MSHEERWILRGSFLVLWMAIQALPSNDCYTIWSREEDDDETRGEMLASGVVSASGPAGRERIDSVANTESSRSATASLWFMVMQGAMDMEKMRSAAEALVEQVWPEEDACSILVEVGHPKPFTHNDELRLRIRDLLFPGYETLTSL